jgi:excinuclease ABC subunit B
MKRYSSRKEPVDPTARPHKPHLDEMGIATWHEFKPARDGEAKARSASSTESPRKPSLDEMGPGVEAVPAKRGPSLEGGRSTMGRPGQHGGFKANKRRR